ncbi:hypothetical protein BKI52_09900 [marine bacterium AO1-C]|nr:hypothetical protein BKI52_09900 [marine bacterium AO1-C]
MPDIEGVNITSSNFMKYCIYLICIGLLLSGCEINPLFRPLAKTNTYDLVFFKTKDIKESFTLKVTDKHLVNDMYTNYITNEDLAQPCATKFDGEMIFKYQTKPLLKIQFSLDSACSYATYTLKGRKYQKKLTADGVVFLNNARDVKFIVQD